MTKIYHLRKGDWALRDRVRSSPIWERLRVEPPPQRVTDFYVIINTMLSDKAIIKRERLSVHKEGDNK